MGSIVLYTVNGGHQLTDWQEGMACKAQTERLSIGGKYRNVILTLFFLTNILKYDYIYLYWEN